MGMIFLRMDGVYSPLLRFPTRVIDWSLISLTHHNMITYPVFIVSIWTQIDVWWDWLKGKESDRGNSILDTSERSYERVGRSKAIPLSISNHLPLKVAAVQSDDIDQAEYYQLITVRRGKDVTMTSFHPLDTLRKSCWEERAKARVPSSVNGPDANTSTVVGRTRTENQYE